jgi:hypothetical protein
MENLEHIYISGKELENLPLFFRHIYHNVITDPKEEFKLIKFNSITQSDLMRAGYPDRPVSKTVDYSLLKKESDGKK